jgi:hypothetical protein
MEARPTMTLNELTCDLRKCGVKTSPTKVKAMIQQGKYSDTEFEIYRKPFEEWKKRMGLRKE